MEVARITRKLLGNDAELIWFGSWPQNRAMPHSDIDIAISCRTPVLPQHITAIREAAEEVAGLYEIEIVDLNVVGSLLRQEIRRHGVTL